MAISNKQLMAMKKLGYSDEEIQQMLADDKAVDRGESMEWDLTPEEHKKAMKYANSTEKKVKTAEKAEKSAKKGATAYNFDTSTKKKKENPTKANIIALLATILTENGDFSAENVEITNKERQIAFVVGENAFELTLVQKRKPK
jgi:hypothetical protein